MPEFCGYGGYCLRLEGHDGAHTRTPMPGTALFDRDRAASRRANMILASLDFPTPDWADLNDPE